MNDVEAYRMEHGDDWKSQRVAAFNADWNEGARLAAANGFELRRCGGESLPIDGRGAHVDPERLPVKGQSVARSAETRPGAVRPGGLLKQQFERG